MEFFLSYFRFLISHPAVKYLIMQSRLRNWDVHMVDKSANFKKYCCDCKLLYTGLTVQQGVGDYISLPVVLFSSPQNVRK